MSRTFRRQRSKKRNSRFERDYTSHKPEVWCGKPLLKYSNNNWFPTIPLEGKDFNRAYWKYHSDCGHSVFGWEKAYETPMLEPENERRRRYSREITKWLKDNSYEIIWQKSKQVWDYC